MLYQIDGFVNCSKWGKVGRESYIDRFLSGEDFTCSHLAELWFGTHPNGISKIQVEGETISLGSHLNSFGIQNGLPYLAKILSIECPLSIQLHPTRKDAEKLHLKDPANYPDINPKPEIAIALSEVALLCGLRDLKSIKMHVSSISAFDILGKDFKRLITEGDLRVLSAYIFKLDDTVLRSFGDKILESNLDDEWSKIVIRHLDLGTPIDPGIVYVYLLEYLKIQPGEAIFIEPGVPHAYLSGDMFECMQTSDNVVRGGLTQKFIDSETFVELFRHLPYRPKLSPEEVVLGMSVYRPKDCPFSVKHLRIGSTSSISIPDQSIVISVDGAGEIKLSDQRVEINRSIAFFLSNGSQTAQIIPKSDLELFIISPN